MVGEASHPALSTTILILADYYLPGWKAGGPIRSISRMVETLGDRFEFLILTCDHDLGESAPYEGIPLGQWTPVGKARVFYGRRHLRRRGIARLVREMGPDLIFTNTLFSTLTLNVLMLRWTRRIDKVPLLIAPRGQLGAGALGYKGLRKRMYLLGARVAGWFRGVWWQASTSEEVEQIVTRVARAVPFVSADIPFAPKSGPVRPPLKTPGSVCLVFTARISPMKNLPFLLRSLSAVSGQVTLDIYGMAEEREWEKVEPLLKSMPPNITVAYHGAVRPEEIDGALAQAHFSVLSTRGENFGHSVYEALRIGRPVIVSDRAPWRGLEQAHAGWSIPLESLQAWTDVLQRCVDLDEGEYHPLSVGAHQYARAWFEATGPVEQQARVFEELIRGGDHGR